ncbi:macrophage colony-stimulating factor 1 isoform X2 [Pipistrellus kuhlii]|nr:macrophage colony-stimulating factor 1 isoform X2 [Pipistrellus kuhlii]
MPKSLKRPCRGAGRRSRRESESSPGAPGAAAGSPHSRDSGAASAGRGLRGGRRASEQARAAEAPGRDPAARMTARGAAGRCPPTTWLGPRLLLVCLLVNRSITEEESKHCSHMIGDGHLQLLQQMIDSQMETGCKIPFQFVNEDQLEDRVCYIKKAFSLAQDIMQETISFKDNTANAIALVKLLELSVRLKDCFPQVSEEHDTACVQNFSESPLWALEKIKNVFNETKNLLKTNQSIFSKNCSDSFAKCSGTNVVTTPDCNCLYPKATPSSDPASASPQQPLAPATAPVAALPWAGSEGTEDSSLLPSEQPVRTEDPGSAKQRPPRSTCQTFESPGTPGAEGGPFGGSPEPPGAAVSGTEDILNSVLGANWALEEASGEASEGPAPRGPEPAPSGRGGGSVQAEAIRHSNLISASLLRGPARGQPPAGVTGTARPRVGPGRSTGQARSRTAEKTDRPPRTPRDAREPGSARPLLLRPRGLSRLSTLAAGARPPRSHTRDSVLPLGGPQGRRSARARRSTAGLEGAPREGAAAPHAHLNPVPLTDDPAPSTSPVLRPLLLPGGGVMLVLVLLAVGGLLLHRRRQRSHRELWIMDSSREQPEGSPLAQPEDRRVETPV